MSSVKEKPMKRKLFATEHEERSDSNATASAEKKRRRKNAVETPKHYPKSERQQLAMVLQMTSVENSPEPASSPPPTIRKTPGGSGRKDKVHKRNVRGETLLHLCTIRGDLEAMKELIRQGADVNVQDFAGWTPLHEACNHGHQEISRYLLQVGANVNSKGLEDDTPLHDAVTNAHKDLVELLLRHGANPLLKNKRGERPLDIAEDQVIRELMQKEIILSEDESESERDCLSPSRSEDSIGSRHAAVSKVRTASTSSSGPLELHKAVKKKIEKSKTHFEKARSFSPLTSDSSSDSDSSEDQPLVHKKDSVGISSSSHSNGYGNSVRKTPTLSATPLKTPKPKQKRKSSDDSIRKSQKIKNSSVKTSFADLTSSSSDAYSDSDHRTQRKDKNGTLFTQSGDPRKLSLASSDKKEHIKQKSLYNNEKSLFSDRNSTQTDSTFKMKFSSHPDQVKRVRSFSSDGDKSKSKLKSGKFLNEKTKSHPETVPPKVNGFQTSSESPKVKKDNTEDSVYDFSISTEDFTDTSAISLKQKYEDKSSELFDILCLGKEVKNESELDRNDMLASKPRKPSSDKSSTVKTQEESWDKNHNRIVFDVEKSTKKAQMLTATSNDTQGHNHVLYKSENQSREVKMSEKPLIMKSSSFSANDGDVSMSKHEPKLEKKTKKQHSLSESPKKPSNNNGPIAFIKSDSVKKEKVEHSGDVKMEKQKKQSFEGDAKTQAGDKSSSSSGSVKKKKKHKHKHSHDSPSEHKHKQRVSSSESMFSEKSTTSERENKNSSTQSKAPIKRLDTTKSQLASTSRKNSQEVKTEGIVIPAAKKKVRSTDSTSSEASAKSSKHSVTKTPKIASSASQERLSVQAKKDKPEAKKIALVSDENSSFLSELEKSSKQRLELERRIKLQRKKKLQQLQQQQRLKAQNAAENASKEAKMNTPTMEKSMPFFTDKPTSESNEFIDASRQQMRVPLHGDFYDHPPGQPDLSYPYRQDVVDPFYENTNSVDRHEFAQGTFKSPPLAGRSISHVDPRGAYPQPQEIWNRGERLPYPLHHEKKHPPVHRSLSFSLQQPDGSAPHRNPQDVPSHPDVRPNMPVHYHDGMHHRHSTGERLPSYPSAPTNIPQPHPANGPLLPPANHLPPHTAVTYVPSAPGSSILQKPAQYFPGTSQPPPATPGVAGTSHLIADVTSNVPISSPLVAAKVPIHPVVATPSTSSASDTPAEGKASSIPCAKDEEVSEAAKNADATRRGSAGEDPETEEENKEPAKDETRCEKKEEEKAESSVNTVEMEHKAALEKYIKDHLSKLEVVIEEPKPKRLPVFIPMEKLKKAAEKDPILDRLNVYEEWAEIQKQINERRKKYYTAVVIPQAPDCYCDYMTYTGAYLLSGNRESWLSVPVLAPPPSLAEEMKALFREHEKERVKLRLQHATQREKLIVACEQEIMRVHSRAARMLQNQQIPLSACSVLLDREIYNLERRNKKVPDDNNGRTSIRDRFNGRMMLSWLQDVDDKYVKMKNVLLARQRHEAQALHAVQRTEWFLKLQEVENQGQQKRWTNSKPEDVSELYVPVVNISDNFDLLPG